MKRVLSVLIILPVLFTEIYGEKLTLAEAVNKGLKENNILNEEAERVRFASSALKQAKMSRLGGFKLKAMYTDGDEPVYAFATAMKQGTFSMASMSTINNPDPIRNYMVGLDLGVPIFTAFSISNYIKASSLVEKATQNGYQRARAKIAFKITWQWLNVLLMNRLSELAANAVASAENELKTAKMLREKGMVLGSDYYGAEAILSTMKSQKLEWEKALKIEKEKLSSELGLMPDELADIDGSLNEMLYPETDIKIFLSSIEDKRLDIKAMKEMVDFSEVNESMQKNSILPVIEAFGSWEANSKSISDFSSSRLIGLRLNMPLGDSAYFAKKDAAKAQVSMAKSRLAETKRQALIEVAEAINNYQSAKENLPVIKQTLENARKSLELFLPLYRQGRQSVLEVLRAQVSLMQAEASYCQTIYKIHLSHAQILLAMEEFNEKSVAEMSNVLSASSYGR